MRLDEFGDALNKNVIPKYCIHVYKIMDQDSAYISLLMGYIFKKFDIKIKTSASCNHQSLLAKHSIKSTILTNYLTH